ESTSWERVFVPSHTSPPASQGYHGHVDAPAPHGPGGSHASNHPEEIIKDPSFIGTKADCVFGKLENTNGNLFRTTIGKFINDPQYDLILKVGDCPNTDVACTDGSKVDINGDI